MSLASDLLKMAALKDAPVVEKREYTSDVKGVHYDKRWRVWFASVYTDGKKVYLYRGKSQEAAEAARLEYDAIRKKAGWMHPNKRKRRAKAAVRGGNYNG